MNFLGKTAVALGTILILLAVATLAFMQQKTFGRNPSGARLDRIKLSPNYRDGAFQNLVPTEVMLESASFFKLAKEFFNKPENTAPPKPLPSVKTDLRMLPADKLTIVWFGHSSYLIKSQNLNILVDPVFSGNASPVSFFGKSFPGSDVYQTADLPPIDLLVLTHDHYDHLDYRTILQLKSNVKTIVTSLGVGAHLEHWGMDTAKITELDWWESKKMTDNVEITATPARHFSGRGLVRGKTLWSSFVVRLHGHRIFVGGDSGCDAQFKIIGEKYGPFDIALLECGQYGDEWPYIHMKPKETATAAQDLQANVLMPVHWGKFALAYHAWNEPIRKLVESATEKELVLATPMIGQPVVLGGKYPQQQWWEF